MSLAVLQSEKKRIGEEILFLSKSIKTKQHLIADYLYDMREEILNDYDTERLNYLQFQIVESKKEVAELKVTWLKKITSYNEIVKGIKYMSLNKK